MANHINREQFITLLSDKFPEVVAAIDDCSQGLLHPEMATFARATQAAIEEGDFDTVKRHFEFADFLLKNAAPDVENAVYVSYLENLDFGGRNPNRPLARELLTPFLANALEELEVYLDELQRSAEIRRRGSGA